MRATTLATETPAMLLVPGADELLAEMIWWVADGMRACPPHEWASPVHTKLEPDVTAWTCRICGSVTKSLHGESPAQ